MSVRHLVLAGAGHAQLDLLASLATSPLDGWRVTLVTSQAAFHYSGLLPALIAGSASAVEAQIPVAAIARAAGSTVHVASVVALDVGSRRLQLDDGTVLHYDLLSLDVGSAPAGTQVAGVREHAFTMRPFAGALALMAHLDHAIEGLPRGACVPAVVVGGGAAGVEIAFAVRQRIHRAGRRSDVTIVDATATDGLPLAGFAPASRRLAGRALRARGIAVRPGTVREVLGDRVVIEQASALLDVPSAATAWVSGPAAQPWLAASGLDCDARGYPFASATLALTADRTVFGGGDCITLRDAADTPKAGVFAVRMAPVLAHNVRAAALGEGSRLKCYTPQSGFLALLSTGDGAALLRWHGVVLEARWALWLKNRIDHRYLDRYRALAREAATANDGAMSIPPPPGLP